VVGRLLDRVLVPRTLLAMVATALLCQGLVALGNGGVEALLVGSLDTLALDGASRWRFEIGDPMGLDLRRLDLRRLGMALICIAAAGLAVGVLWPRRALGAHAQPLLFGLVVLPVVLMSLVPALLAAVLGEPVGGLVVALWAVVVLQAGAFVDRVRGQAP